MKLTVAQKRASPARKVHTTQAQQETELVASMQALSVSPKSPNNKVLDGKENKVTPKISSISFGEVFGKEIDSTQNKYLEPNLNGL